MHRGSAISAALREKLIAKADKLRAPPHSVFWLSGRPMELADTEVTDGQVLYLGLTTPDHDLLVYTSNQRSGDGYRSPQWFLNLNEDSALVRDTNEVQRRSHWTLRIGDDSLAIDVLAVDRYEAGQAIVHGTVVTIVQCGKTLNDLSIEPITAFDLNGAVDEWIRKLG